MEHVYPNKSGAVTKVNFCHSPFFDLLGFPETWTKRQLATLNPVRQLFHPEIIRLTLLMLAN